MTDVFISYSRRDEEFVQRLRSALDARGKDVWFDRDDIGPAVEWRNELALGIEGADTFALVITPDSLRSEVCRHEWTHAVDQRKRLLPLLRREPDGNTVPDEFASRNYVFFRETDDFAGALDSLVAAIDDLPEWARVHTRLLERAEAWNRKGRDNSLLLRGSDLRDAEGWLAQQAAHREPQPTPLQSEYILASRRATSRRQRITIGAILIALAATALLAVVALLQRNEARDQRNEAVRQARLATSRQLAVEAQAALRDRRLDRALLLGAEAYERDPSAEARDVLLSALAGSSQLRRLLHDRPAALAAVDARGTTLALARQAGGVAVWDLVKGRLETVVPLSRQPTSLAVSADGRAVVLGFRGLDVHVWDLDRRRWVPAFGPPGTTADFGQQQVFSTAAASAGLVAWAGGRVGVQRIGVWNGREMTYLIPDGFACEVSVNADGSMLAVVGVDGPVAQQIAWTDVWRLRDGVPEGNPVRIRPGTGFSPDPGGCSPPSTAAFSPTRPTLLAVGSWDGTVSLWDASSGAPVGGSLKSSGGVVSHVGFSGDGSAVLARDGEGVALWDVESQARLPISLPQAATDLGVWPTNDGAGAVLVGPTGTVALAELRRPLVPLARPLAVDDATDVAFSPDGSIVATARADGSVQLWRTASGRPTGDEIATGLDLPRIAFGPDELVVWGAASHGERVVLQPLAHQTQARTVVLDEGRIAAVGFRPDGTPIAVVPDLGTTLVQDLRRDTQIGSLEGEVTSVDVGKDVRRVAGNAVFGETGSRSAVAVWDVATGDRIGSEKPASLGVALSPAGDRLATAGSRTITFWDVDGDRRLGTTAPVAGDGGPSSLVFGPDATMLAALVSREPLVDASGGVTYLGGLQLWDVARQTLVADLVPSAPVAGQATVRFSSAGRLATVGLGGQPMLWNLDPKRFVAIACRLAGRSLTRSEWTVDVGPDVEYAPACP